MTTAKPSCASRSATAAPMLRDAPVTMATLSVFWFMAALLRGAERPVAVGDSAFDYPDNPPCSVNTIRYIRTIMDRLDAMRLYTRIVERRSFTRAAQDLGLPRSTVTDAVKDIEARLGVQLLARTTRHVSPT